LLSKDSYLLEGLQNADKTKTHPKAKLQNAHTFTGNGSHFHVSTNDIHRCLYVNFISVTCSPHNAKTTLCISGFMDDVMFDRSGWQMWP